MGVGSLPPHTSFYHMHGIINSCLYNNRKDDHTWEMNHQFPIRTVKYDCFLSELVWKANGKMTHRLCSPSELGGEIMWGARFQRNVHQACQQNCSHPHRGHKASQLWFQKHTCINQVIAHLTLHQSLCAWAFCRCLGHLLYLALKTRFSLIDRILSNSSWLVWTNRKIWEWYMESSGTYRCSKCAFCKVLAADWILNHRKG